MDVTIDTSDKDCFSNAHLMSTTSNDVAEVLSETKPREAEDLDKCIENILSWEKCIINLNTEVQDLKKEKKSLLEKVDLLKKKETCDSSTICDLQQSVKTLHEILQIRLDQEGALQSLREQLSLQQEKAAQAANKLKLDTQSFKLELKRQQEKNKQDVDKLKEDLQAQYMKKEKELHENLHCVKVKLEAECNRRQEIEKMHENALVKMQMEYESKIAVMQVQNNRLHSNCNNVDFASKEVFRKKLQHIQEQSSREIARLKQEVSVLQLKLGARPDGVENHHSPRPNSSRSGILKRRKF